MLPILVPARARQRLGTIVEKEWFTSQDPNQGEENAGTQLPDPLYHEPKMKNTPPHQVTKHFGEPQGGYAGGVPPVKLKRLATGARNPYLVKAEHLW